VYRTAAQLRSLNATLLAVRRVRKSVKHQMRRRIRTKMLKYRSAGGQLCVLPPLDEGRSLSWALSSSRTVASRGGSAPHPFLKPDDAQRRKAELHVFFD
jgi:hypothetical protein